MMFWAIAPEKTPKACHLEKLRLRQNPQKTSHGWMLYDWQVVFGWGTTVPDGHQTNDLRSQARNLKALKLFCGCCNKHKLLLAVSEAGLWARVRPLWSLRSSQGTQQYTPLHCSLVSERGQRGFELTLKGFSSCSVKQLKLLITLLTEHGERQ